ncbi:hypothetical protein LJC08_00385 [Methanimicrococcus sp. OttesenSCG-928-J09]|nr:hypothetical protein [Methanimicrococcus sp. OttesenSCG-928-J09]
MSPTAAVLLTTPSAQGFSQSFSDDLNESKEFVWYFDGKNHSYTYNGPIELYEYYLNKNHIRTDYNQYALSEYDRWAVKELADYFKEYGRQHNQTEEKVTANVISFVQSIPYTTDFETKSVEDYPRYPIETLSDGTGDCEDTVILAAAVLDELGYDSVLILLPEHMALGVRDLGNYSGQYYEYEGLNYYYVETTSSGHDVGFVPEEINPKLVEIFPMVQKPEISASALHKKTGSSGDFFSYDSRIKIENDGPGVGKNITVEVYPVLVSSSRSSGTGSGSSGADLPEQIFYAGNISEDGSRSLDFSIQVPKGSGNIYYIISGDNFESFMISGFRYADD